MELELDFGKPSWALAMKVREFAWALAERRGLNVRHSDVHGQLFGPVRTQEESELMEHWPAFWRAIGTIVVPDEIVSGIKWYAERILDLEVRPPIL